MQSRLGPPLFIAIPLALAAALTLLLFAIPQRAQAAESPTMAGSGAAPPASSGAALGTGAVDSDGALGFVMPPNAEVAYQEYARNNDRIDALQREIEKQTSALSSEGERYEANKKKLETALRLLSAVAGRCSPAAREEEARKQQAEDVRQSLKSLVRIVKGDPTEILPKFEIDYKLLCQTNAAAEFSLLRPEQIRDFLDQIDAMRAKWVQAAQQELDKRNKEKASREKLRTQLGGALEKLRTQIERTSNFSDLKWLVLILGILSVLVMLIVRTFPQELQTEWVASGQVIQFMTVLVILIAILSLGINGILREETLGTLLGGIGGYVLAQGVGRAAVRSAIRQSSGAPTSSPAPTSPPPASPVSASAVSLAPVPVSSKAGRIADSESAQ